MKEVRLAKKGEITGQKEIWKLCFGDEDPYIDFYYSNRYKEDETALLLLNGEITSMLTMLPVKIVTPVKQSIDSAMLYAIATHPKHQKKGLASELMDFSKKHLKSKRIETSILVPAEKDLFDFYYKQGYQDGFYIREIQLTQDRIEELPIYKTCKLNINPVVSEGYNFIRNEYLCSKMYVEFSNADIEYQKKLSRLTGGEIYEIEVDGRKGCVAIENLSSEKVMIKEILVPEEYINLAIGHITHLLNAKEYIVRTPAFLGESLGGVIRPFGMIQGFVNIYDKNTHDNLGYLGLAFD